MKEIYENRMLLTSVRDRSDGWVLRSGIWSPFYIQLRLLSSFPSTLRKVAKAMTIILRKAAPYITRLVGIAFAGIPIATALSLESGLPACHTRKLFGASSDTELQQIISEYGQHTLVEGVIQERDALCLVDDLVTGMESKFTAHALVMTEIKRRGLSNVQCNDIIVLIDRQQGAYERASEAGFRLHSVIGLIDEGLPLIRDIMDPEEYAIVMDYLKEQRQTLS